MKTPIIFEKDDILKLVYVFLKKKGFAIPSPDKVTYKGALQVTVSVEYDLETSEIEEAFAPKGVAPKVEPATKSAKGAPVPVTPPPATEDAEPEPDMEAIMRQSTTLARQPAPYGTPPPRPEEPEDRPLGENESFEWPGEPRGK